MHASKDLLVSWFMDHGGYLHPSVEITVGSLGNCLRVKLNASSVESTSKIVSCPRALMVSLNNAKASKTTTSLVERAPSQISNEIISLRFFLIEQYLIGRDSFWWPYIQSLPQPGDVREFSTTVFFDEIDLQWLEGTNLGAATQTRKVIWRREFDDAMAVLQSGFTDVDWGNWTWFVGKDTQSNIYTKFIGISTCGLQRY